MKNIRRRKQFAIFACCCLISFIFLVSQGLCAQEGAAEEDIYSQDIKPLTTRECARCHYSVFLSIKNGKGAHKKECMFCHKTYHSFQRGLAWDERVPQCQKCHELPHGDSGEMTACLKCHANAHAPLASIDIKSVEPFCTTCHAQQTKEMKDYPSGHSAVNCSVCHHDTHGYRPACTECHEKPHTRYEDNAACMACHNPHMPTNINYGTDVPDKVCAGCHPDPVERMNATSAAHGSLHCVFCHAEKHGNIPSCQSCHSIPHAQKMIEKFGDCSKCHGNPHDLNMKK